MAAGGGENPEVGVVNQTEPNKRILVAGEEERSCRISLTFSFVEKGPIRQLFHETPEVQERFTLSSSRNFEGDLEGLQGSAQFFRCSSGPLDRDVLFLKPARGAIFSTSLCSSCSNCLLKSTNRFQVPGGAGGRTATTCLPLPPPTCLLGEQIGGCPAEML